MADQEYLGIPVSDLTEATQVTEEDLLLLEQASTPKKLTGKTLVAYLMKMLDGHGGIKSNVLTKTEGLVKTYTTTYADGTVDTYTVTDGAKGDPGRAGCVWIKYASQMPTEDSPSMSSIPDEWIGICSGFEDTEPTEWWMYDWFRYKGEIGPQGNPGPTPKLTIGVVTTISPGKQATASITGTPENPILNLSIPRGWDGENGAGVPDWSVNDPGREGYVKNRTHFVKTYEESVAETALDFSTQNYAKFSLYYLETEHGKRFKVVWNGTTYYCAMWKLSNPAGCFALGNLNKLDEAFPDTGEPFHIVYYPDQESQFVVFNHGTETAASFALYYGEEVEPLAAKYLPGEWNAIKHELGVDGVIYDLPTGTQLTGTAANIVRNFVPDSFVEGASYTVEWQGESYDLTCYSESGSLCLGNKALGGFEGGTGEPFFIQNLGSEAAFVYKEAGTLDGYYSLRVVGHKQVSYDKLPAEFLPGGVAGKVIEIVLSGNSATANVDFETAWAMEPAELEAAACAVYTIGTVFSTVTPIAHVNKYTYGSNTRRIYFTTKCATLDAEVNNVVELWYWDADGITHSSYTHTVKSGGTYGAMLQWGGMEWKAEIPTEYYIASPNGSVFKITVDDSGNLTTVSTS